ncbi:MAG: hypothetical protein M9927_08735, partial [Anaerolineae bacterium]|nr:hypothetical protein [Anaerolineae bacterium]
MRYYLSGVADRADAQLLLEMGIPNILIDPFQFWQIGLDLVRQFPHVALDSGSYRIWKQEKRQPNSTDVAPIVRVLDQWDGFDFWVMPDDIPLPHAEGGLPDYNWSAVSTRCIWEIAATEHDRRHREIPVWHWGESDYYLDKYWLETRKLGIGGMVSIFRGGHRQQDKKKKALLDVARTEVVRRLDALLRAKLQAYGAADHLHL